MTDLTAGSRRPDFAAAERVIAAVTTRIEAFLADLQAADPEPARWAYLAAEAVRLAARADYPPLAGSGCPEPMHIAGTLLQLQSLCRGLPALLCGASRQLSTAYRDGQLVHPTDLDPDPDLDPCCGPTPTTGGHGGRHAGRAVTDTAADLVSAANAVRHAGRALERARTTAGSLRHVADLDTWLDDEPDDQDDAGDWDGQESADAWSVTW